MVKVPSFDLIEKRVEPANRRGRGAGAEALSRRGAGSGFCEGN
jgi:hypothetical protein